VIAEAQAVGYVTTVAVYSGVFILIHIVWRQWHDNPLLPRNDRPFRPVDPFGLCLVAVGVFIAQQSCLSLVMSEQFAGTHWGLVGILAALIFGVIVYGFAARRVMRPRGRVRLRVGQGLLVVWASLPVVYGVLLLIGWLSGIHDRQESIEYMAKGGAGWEYFAGFAVVVAPLLEEIVFRGLLYPAIRARYGAIAALVFTSALFGLVHVQINVVIPLGIFGLFLGVLVERTGSILPCVVAHVAFNGLAVAQIVVG